MYLVATGVVVVLLRCSLPHPKWCIATTVSLYGDNHFVCRQQGRDLANARQDLSAEVLVFLTATPTPLPRALLKEQAWSSQVLSHQK